MLKVALMVVYNDDAFMEETLEAIKDKIEQVWFLVPNQTWNGFIDEIGHGRVMKIIAKFLKKFPNWRLMRTVTKNQADTLNYGLKLLFKEKYAHAMILDSDEIWDTENFDKLNRYIKTIHKDVYACKAHTYFKSIKYRIHPPQTFSPVVAVRSYVRFEHARRTNSARTTILPDVFYHHPSHVRPDLYMDIKLKSCSERDKVKDWYKDVWLKWTPDMKNFHPTQPEAFQEVRLTEKIEIPKVLHKYLDM